MINEFQPMNHLSRLQNFICTIGNLPTSYALSLSYEEQVWWLCNFLETKIFPALETNTEITEETQKAFLELQQYVTDYFNNLDVQDEINNKLDEMLESGIFQELFEQKMFKDLISNVQLIIPKNFNTLSGQTFIVKAYNKIIMFDTHRTNALSEILQFLENNNIEHVDYLILSHYHDDHCGNVVSLINLGIVDENTIVFIPAYSPLIEQSEQTQEYYTSVNNALTSHNIPHHVPVENETLEIEDFKITFYNCETSIFNSMGVTNYNDCSTVCLCEYGNQKMLFTGDITDKPFKRFVDNRIFNFKINIYQIEHHGNNIDNQSTEFLKQITPDLAFQCANLQSAETGLFTRSTAISYFMMNKKPLYSQFNNNNDIILDIYKTYSSLKQGKQNDTQTSYGIHNDIYVNSSTTNTVQNGTSLYPFKNILQALAKINKLPYATNTIHLADGEYDFNFRQYVSGSNIQIVGNTNDKTKVKIKNGLIFYDCHVYIHDLTLINNNDNSLAFRFCNAVVENCEITSENNEITTHTGLYSYSSKITVRNSNINHSNLAISLHYDNIYINNLDISNCNRSFSYDRSQYCHINVNESNITNDNAFTNSRNYSYDTRPEKQSEVLFQGSLTPAINEVITLNKNIQNYNFLIISYGNVGDGTWYSYLVNCYQNEFFQNGQKFRVRGGQGAFAVQIQNSNELLIQNIYDTAPIVRQIVGLKK